MKTFLEHEVRMRFDIETATKWTITIVAGLLTGVLGALYLIAVKFGEK